MNLIWSLLSAVLHYYYLFTGLMCMALFYIKGGHTLESMFQKSTPILKP